MRVVATDLEPNLPLLQQNCDAHGKKRIISCADFHMIASRQPEDKHPSVTTALPCCATGRGRIQVMEHTWGEDVIPLGPPFDVVLASGASWLGQGLEQWNREGGDARTLCRQTKQHWA